MKKEFDSTGNDQGAGKSFEKRMPMPIGLRFSGEALEFMDRIGPTRQLWMMETLDAEGAVQAVEDIYESKGNVTKVDARECFDNWTEEFTLPEVNGGLMILTNLDELCFSYPSVDMWWKMHVAGDKFAKNKDNLMFIPHHPVLSRRPGPNWMASGIRWHAFSDEPVDENLMSVAYNSPSFSDAWGNTERVGNWIKNKWFASIEREPLSVKLIVWEMVKKLAVGREPYSDEEFMRVMKEVVPEITGKYGFPRGLEKYEENAEKGLLGNEKGEVRQWLIEMAMLKWREGGWRMHPAIKLPVEALFAATDKDGYEAEVKKLVEYYMECNRRLSKSERWQDGAEYFLKKAEEMVQRGIWITDSVKNFFGDKNESTK